MVAEELKVVIRAEAQRAAREISEVTKQTNKAENSTRKLITTMAKSAAGFAAAAVSVRALIGAVKESVQLAREQEQAERSLEAALISTGDATGEGAIMLRQYASELQGVTTFGDEATLAAAALFTQLSGGTAQMTKDAIPAIQDFASAMGMDLNSAAQLVGKSVGSSTNALMRYGIEIDNSLEGTERMEAIVTQLNDKFGGFSRQLADTASGSLTQFNNALGDFKELGGESILNFIQPATTALTNYITRLNETISAKRTLNELEGVATISAAQERINAYYSQREQQLLAIDEVEQQLLENRQAIEREQRIGNEQAEQQFKDARVLYLEERDRLQDRKQAIEENIFAERNLIAELRDRMNVSGDAQTVDIGGLLDVDMAGDAGENAGDAAAEGFYRSMDEATRDARSRMAPLLPIDTIVMESEEAAEKVANNWSGAFSSISGSAMSTFSMLVNLQQEQTNRQMAAIDEQLDAMTERFEREQAFAEAAGASDEELAELRKRQLEEEKEAEKEADEQKKQLAMRQFRRQQALNVANVVQQTALAVVRAFADLGPIAGPIAAASIGALGAAQLGIISQQQPPAFEKGGSFVTNGPQMIQVGDGQSPRERVTVEPLSGPYRGSTGGDVININFSGVISEDNAVKVVRAIERAKARGVA